MQSVVPRGPQLFLCCNVAKSKIRRQQILVLQQISNETWSFPFPLVISAQTAEKAFNATKNRSRTLR